MDSAVATTEPVRRSRKAFPAGRGFVGWVLQRLTGLVLSVCLIIHVVSTHLMRRGELDAGFVRDRLTYESMMTAFYAIFLVALIFHALNGVWAVFLDFNPGRVTRRTTGFTLYLLGATVFAIGFLTLRGLQTL